ncbi:hypothetical protein [Streptomyces atroolivaceus]|uniref:hypothetical protein n=1 Tax=Streptomyces atroolivaceus TaxID=66869 RepID=UPI0034379E26
MTSVYMPLSRGRCFVEDADSHLRGLGPRRPVGDGQETFGGRFTGGSSDFFAPPIPLKAAGTPRRLTWYISTPATANDGGTVFQPRAATFGLSH